MKLLYIVIQLLEFSARPEQLGACRRRLVAGGGRRRRPGGPWWPEVDFDDRGVLSFVNVGTAA